MEQGDHSSCPIELLACSLHRDGVRDRDSESRPGGNVFTYTLQILMDDAGVDHDGHGGTEPEEEE